MVTTLAGYLAFLVIISVRLATTSTVSSEVFLVIQQISLVVAVSAIAYRIFTNSIFNDQIVAIGVYFAALSWAFFLALVNDVAILGGQNIIADLVVVTLGIFLVPIKSGTSVSARIALAYVLYSLIILLITIATDGLFIGVPPRFSFEFGSEQFGEKLDYGQGPSFFFGLSSIASTYLWKLAKATFLKTISVILAILFLGLSVLGGARGESVIAAGIILLIFFSTAPKRTLAAILVAAFFVLLSSSDFSWIEDLTFVLRMVEVSKGDYGMRDVLSAQVINLLARDPWCMLLGCGPGYFQNAYGYEFGFYPHNILLEGLVIFGVPTMIIAILIAANGARIHWKQSGHNVDLFVLMFTYHTAVAMKSGYFFGSWVTLIGFSYFIAVNFERDSGRVKVSHPNGQILR
jgi:hypothetical protein